jgi:hypothetical protein
VFRAVTDHIFEFQGRIMCLQMPNKIVEYIYPDLDAGPTERSSVVSLGRSATGHWQP